MSQDMWSDFFGNTRQTGIFSDASLYASCGESGVVTFVKLTLHAGIVDKEGSIVVATLV